MGRMPLLIARLLMGIIFLAAGANGYAVLFGAEPFLPTSPAAIQLLGTGYLLFLEKSTELVAGIFLLFGIFIPLALVVLAPITINILFFHLFADQGPLLLLAILLTFLHSCLLWKFRKNYQGLLEKKSDPA